MLKGKQCSPHMLTIFNNTFMYLYYESIANRKTRQDKTRPGEARQGETRQDKARQGKARQDKMRRGKARQDKTCKTRRDKMRLD